MEYQGKLESSDAYMNLQLLNTEEFIDGQLAGYLGEVLIRCNNVLYIKAAENQDEGGEEGGDTAMKEWGRPILHIFGRFLFEDQGKPEDWHSSSLSH